MIRRLFGKRETEPAGMAFPTSWGEAAPVLRPRLYSSHALAGQPGEGLVVREPADDLVAVLMCGWRRKDSADQAVDGYRSVDTSMLSDWGVDADAAWARALDNVTTSEDLTFDRDVAREKGADVVAVFCATTFGSTLALGLERIAPESLSHGAILAVPDITQVLYHALERREISAERDFMIWMATYMFNASDAGISPHLYWWRKAKPWIRLTEIRDGRVEYVAPPEFETELGARS